MPKTYYLDKRLMPNGKNGQTNLDNTLNLLTYIQQVSQPLVDSIATTINETISALTSTVVTEETYDVIPTDYRVLVDQTSLEAVTINLPTAVGITGKTYFIQAITFTDPVTVTVDGVELINNTNAIVLNANYEYVEVVAANGQWYIVNSNYTTP